MSTVQIGDEFENKVYKLFSTMLEDGNFFIPFSNSKIFQKKRYYSEQRKDDIIFDIAIESYIPGQETPSLIVFIECKKYSGKVPISDIEEFHSKVSQIAPNANKAILVTNNSFSESGMAYARSNHIALVRYFDDKNIKWMVTRETLDYVTYLEIESAENEIMEAFRTEDYKILNNNIIFFNERPIYNYLGFIDSIYNNENKHGHISNYTLYEKLYGNKIEENITNFIDEKELVKIANNFRDKLFSDYNFKGTNIPQDLLIKYLLDKQSFIVKYVDDLHITQPMQYLAYIDYENKTIYVLNDILKYENRLKFTLVHEISHLLLHRKLLGLKSNKELLFITGKEKEKIELQANKLTSYILLPPDELSNELRKIIIEFKLNSNRGYYIYLDSQSCNIQQWNIIANRLSNIFGVSKEVLKIRLQELGFLKIED